MDKLPDVIKLCHVLYIPDCTSPFSVDIVTNTYADTVAAVATLTAINTVPSKGE